MALVPATAAGVFCCHLAVQDSCGVRAVTRFTLQIRIGVEALARAMMSVGFVTGWFVKPRIGISMFDCPEQSHTSPISTSFSVRCSPSLRSIV